MTQNVYRDVAASTGHASVFELVTDLLANGWTTVSYSDGTTRTATTANCPSAATLNNVSAYTVLTHTVTGIKLGLQRKADSNTWTIQITEGGQSLTGGNATTMESNATYTKTLLNNAQLYPSAGTTTVKLHTVVDNASASFCIMGRRSPFVGGSTSCCFLIYLDYFTPLTWSANPQPWIAGVKFDNSDVAAATLTANSVNGGWYKRGISGEAWSAAWILENPGTVAGNSTSDPSGSDVEFEVRWVGNNMVQGKSTLFKLVQPFRTPTGGMDSGSSFARAAFGQVTVPNDGTALGS